MKVTASVQVLPLKGYESIEKVIDAVLEGIKALGLGYEVNAHSTVVEGDFEEVVKLFERLGRICEDLCERCVLSVQVDVKRGGVGIEEKVGRYR